MERRLKTGAFILLILTILWVIFTIISMSGIEPDWDKADYVHWVANPDIFFTMNYVNVTLLTLLVVIFFSFLYNYLKEENRNGAIAGLVFVPIYGTINLISYSIQISLVPDIARDAIENHENIVMASELIQANSHSLIGFFNGLAYAILGIPSIIYGVLLHKKAKRLSGVFLLINGIMCITGLIGYIMNSAVIALGIMIGGILFLLSLLFMSIEFKNKS